jgi:hypothetical protein
VHTFGGAQGLRDTRGSGGDGGGSSVVADRSLAGRGGRRSGSDGRVGSLVTIESEVIAHGRQLASSC